VDADTLLAIHVTVCHPSILSPLCLVCHGQGDQEDLGVVSAELFRSDWIVWQSLESDPINPMPYNVR